MKNKKEVIRLVMLLFIFSVISIAFLNQSHDLKSKNEILKKENNNLKTEAVKLKNNTSKLEENIRQIKLDQEEKNNKSALNINYTDVTDNVRFIEKESHILQLPQSGSIAMRPVYPNTLVKVYEKALVNGETWLFIEIPTYDSPENNRGWLKESDSVPLTKEKVKLVQNIEIQAGSEYYETEEFKDIKTTTPKKFEMLDIGWLVEKNEGYCKVSQAGGRTVWVKESSIIYPEVK